MIADRRLCLDRSKARLVEAGTMESAYLLAGMGQEIEQDDVRRLGLVLVDGRVTQPSQDPPAVMPGPAAEMAPESPAAPAGEPQPLADRPSSTEVDLSKPLMAPEVTRHRRRRRS